MCCILAKRAAAKEDKDFPGVLPAITWEIQVWNNLPVSVPVCGMHINASESSGLVKA